MKFLRVCLWLLVGVMPSASLHASEQNVFQSTQQRIPLLELYSSEGSKTCPEADQWFARFQTHPELWVRVVPVAFQVTYWDSMGWKDPFGSPEHDARLQAYAEAWENFAIKVPAVVANGTELDDVTGWDISKIPVKATGLLTAKALDANEFLVTYRPGKDQENKKLEAHAVLMAMAVRSQVLTGENAGKILDHTFVVLSYRHKWLEPASGLLSASVTFSASARRENIRQYGVAFWVTSQDSAEPLQAVGGYLTEPKH